MEDYLARLFNHGASLVNVFGWGIGNEDNLFRRATEGATSIAAYKKFLQGVQLQEAALTSVKPDSRNALQERMHALPGRIEAYIQSGGDPHLIQPHVKQLESNMRDGKLDALAQELGIIDRVIGKK